MKNHFYMAYTGNKRTEVKEIYENLNFDNIDTIIEPFCGSQSMSYYISTQQPKKFKYIFNDNNIYLIEMFNIMKDDDKIIEFENKINELLQYINYEKEKYKEIVKQQNIYSWFIGNKFYQIRPYLFPIDKKILKKKWSLKNCDIYNFYKNEDIEFYCMDWLIFFEKYKNNSNALMLLDPPYLSTSNDFYHDASTNIYEYFYNNEISKYESKIYLILENIWIIELLFRKFIIKEYNKQYNGFRKKTTTHIIISNIF